MQAIKTNNAAVFFRLVGSLLYKEVGAKELAYLKENDIFAEIPYAAGNSLVLQGGRNIAEWLAEYSLEELTDRASDDYMKLFIGVGKVLAPPWSSCYLTEERLIFQKQTLEVREFYASYGLKLKNKYSEPDDHIGLELEFLARLLEESKDEAAIRFAENHIFTWVFEWLKDVEESAMTGFYKGLARLASGGVEHFVQMSDKRT